MSSLRRNAGFSLVEVMCAILILGISLVGLTQGITAALRSSKESELQTTAALIAAGQIETLRAEGFVIDGETEGVREFGEPLHVVCVLQKLRELPFEVVFARYEVKHRLLRLDGRARPRKRHRL